ncbi:unnamed protein product [Protopolystoma xenopodis]|uniref:Uncharacterized protein n=1 Tax=Protopolystoma xenopodis TaxID=117903 RepID=A0A448XHP9_9PLAT|nr:unnamed protein product [Protopolystoma xenopodis]
MVLMARLTDDASETSGKVPRPWSDFGNDHAYNALCTRSHTSGPLSSSQVEALGHDGEALFNFVISASDPASVESQLTQRQHCALQAYRELAIRLAVDNAVPDRKVH